MSSEYMSHILVELDCHIVMHGIAGQLAYSKLQNLQLAYFCYSSVKYAIKET
jgi:hypothetical protein